MNKARRQELKMLKYKARLKKWGLKEGKKKNLYAFRSHGKPCSCYLCRGDKYSRAKEKLEFGCSIVREFDASPESTQHY